MYDMEFNIKGISGEKKIDIHESPCSAKANYSREVSKPSWRCHGGQHHPGFREQTVPGSPRTPGLGSGGRTCPEVQVMWRICLQTEKVARLQTAFANEVLSSSFC